MGTTATSWSPADSTTGPVAGTSSSATTDAASHPAGGEPFHSLNMEIVAVGEVTVRTSGCGYLE